MAEELPNKYSDTHVPPPVETYGLPLVTAGESAEVGAYQGAIDDADRWLRRAQAALTSQDGGPFAGPAQCLAAEVHKVAAEVRAARPAAVCPFCKRLPQFVAGCSGCKGTGFVAADVMLGVADELKLGGDQAMVATPGGPLPYGKAANTPVIGVSKAKKVRIEDEHGEELVPDPPHVYGSEDADDGLPF